MLLLFDPKISGLLIDFNLRKTVSVIVLLRAQMMVLQKFESNGKD